MKTNRTLTKINLSPNDITDVGVQAGVSETVFRWIFVECGVNQSNSITKFGTEAGIPQSLFNWENRDISSQTERTGETNMMEQCRVTGSTPGGELNWQVIAEVLKTNKTLTYIDLSHNRITDMAVQAGMFLIVPHFVSWPLCNFTTK